MTGNQVAERTGLDRKTVKQICEEELVRKGTWDKLVRGLGVLASEVPTN